MKNHQFIKCISFLLIFSFILPATAFAQDKIIGQVLTTDIRAYINDCEIPSYNINGKLAVIVSDLNHYGFITSYNNDKRLSSVVVNPKAGELTGVPATSSNLSVGTPVMNVYATDIAVELNGSKVESFNIGGKMAVYFKDLQCFGTYQYDNATRSSRLSVTASAAAANTPITEKTTAKANEPITEKEKDISILRWKHNKNSKLIKDYTTNQKDTFSYCISDSEANVLGIVKKYVVKPNTAYVISVDVKTKDIVNHENTINPLGANICVGDFNNSKGILGTQDWQTIYVVGCSDEEGILNVSMNLGYWSNACTGTAWFENIKVTPAEEFKADDPTWKFLFVVLTNTSLNTYDEDLKKQLNISHKMTDAEYKAICKSITDFEEDLTTKSNGILKAEAAVVKCDTKISDYEKSGNGYYITNSTAWKYVDENNINIDGYDHVFFIISFPKLPRQYFGLGGTFITGDIGFSLIMYGDGATDCTQYCYNITENNWPAGLYVHEFLHSIETYAKKFGYTIPSPDGSGQYGYGTENLDGWRKFYMDIVNNKVKYNGTYTGVNPLVWNVPPHLLG